MLRVFSIVKIRSKKPSKKPSKTPSIFIRFFFELLVEHILFFSRKLNSFHLKQELFTANLNKPWPRGNSFARHLSNPSLTKHCSIKKSNNWKKQQIEYCNCAYRNLALCPNCTHFIIYIYIYINMCVLNCICIVDIFQRRAEFGRWHFIVKCQQTTN